ncbi:hypothetical protein CALVIDRAFT_257754 [Calocera viscosa TUFC12733]|uniref:Uncharacterized protein n=1 Tax=Calocera viscosa (strain TUFC12733) TaxID=1330018 RepID=A0A167JAZ0_CALVF|nr:hypothetical protein CALVIDRAFT_257754 [Calocera viscosa TUFC12733]
MEVLGAALRFVTGLPQPAVPAPVPSEIIARVATIRTARVRRRGYGLEDRERPRRVTRSMAPKVVATPAPAATGAEFGFNPVIPESAVGISRTLSANAEQQELRERRGSPKRKKTMKRTIRVKPTVDMNNIPDDILFLIMAEVAKEDPTFCRTSNRVCRYIHPISARLTWTDSYLPPGDGTSSVDRFPRSGQTFPFAARGHTILPAYTSSAPVTVPSLCTFETLACKTLETIHISSIPLSPSSNCIGSVSRP